METAKKLGYWSVTGVKVDKLLISLHLLKMELYLKLVNTKHLDDIQKSNRTKVISILKEYRQNNNFPTRDDGPLRVRLPRFVGSNGVPCAMGYILQKTGGMNLYNEISTNRNDIYVEDIENKEYDNWLFKNGMTKEETADIQPTYWSPPDTVYDTTNPYYLWGITIALTSLILLFTLTFLYRLALKKPIKIISTILLTIVSFFISFNITHYLLKETCTKSTVGTGFNWMGEYKYSPEGCEEKLNSQSVPSYTNGKPAKNGSIEIR